MDLQQIMQWFGYDVLITCEVVTKDKLNDIEESREEPNPSPSLDVTGKHFETPTVSVQQIEQQVQRVTQNIANWLVDHVNQQAGWLEAIVSKNTNINDERQNGDTWQILPCASCIGHFGISWQMDRVSLQAPYTMPF